MKIDLHVKQVIVIRKDLNMRKGKIAAQAAHASVKVITDLATITHQSNGQNNFAIDHVKQELCDWLATGMAKICVFVNSEAELEEIYDKASRAKMYCSMITDAGRTEFHGVPTKTVIAIGPATSEAIDKITGHLKLL